MYKECLICWRRCWRYWMTRQKRFGVLSDIWSAWYAAIKNSFFKEEFYLCAKECIPLQKATYSIGDANTGIPQDIVVLRELLDIFDKDLHRFMGMYDQYTRQTIHRKGT